MKNKKINLKLGLLVMIIGCFSLSLTSAATKFKWNMILDDLSASYIKENIIPIHFADNGNDFGGFFYFSKLDEEEPEDDSQSYNLKIGGGNGYECKKQVKGFYYNAERGDRLRPLDQDTFSGVWRGGTVTGGFYTTCYSGGYSDAIEECLSGATAKDGSVVQTGFDECKDEVRANYKTDGNGYYGYVKHTYSGQDMGVVVGVNYTGYENNNGFISIADEENFSPSFIRAGNGYPVGFAYDYNGGVGLVGCKVNNTTTGTKTIVKNYYVNRSDLNELFIESGGNLEYSGSDGAATCSSAVWDPMLGIVIEGVVGMGETGNDNKFEVIGNQKNQKMQYFSSADINNNTIFNYARKKAELLCRGKWKNINNCSSENVSCIDDSNAKRDKIILPDNCKNKTIIVKNRNVQINPFNNSADTGYYDIFIDSGNLIINETEPTEQFVFNKNGFISNEDTGFFLGNVRGAAGNYQGDDVSVGSFIRGNFIINGNIESAGGSGLVNKYFIHGKISTRDTFDTLLETFKWRCNNGRATNDTYCPLSLKESGWINPYEYAALVIIDQNYSSPFFNNY